MGKKNKNPTVEIYDPQLDAIRAITQADVDRLVDTANAYGHLIQSMMRMHIKLFPDSKVGKGFALLLPVMTGEV